MGSLFRRILWQVNRTPLAYLIKFLLSIFYAPSLAIRRALVRNMIVQTDVQEKAIRFRENGYVILTDIVDLNLAEALADASEKKLDHIDVMEKNQALTHKQFWVRLLDTEMIDGAFDADSIFVKFAVQPKLVEFLCAYIGLTPQLMDVLLTYSKPSDGILSYSQLWHRDHDDVQTIKVFVYLTDVNGLADGPFTFLKGPASDKIGFQLKSHLDDEYFYSRVNGSELVEFCAPRLTVFACETSRCFHMGSRILPGASRLMYTATFIKPPSLFPRKKPRFRGNPKLGPVERSILGL